MMQQRVQHLLSIGARLPSSWLRLGMMGLLLLLICQQLAVWTWRVLLPAQPMVNAVSLSPAHATSTPSQTTVYTLFGRSPSATSLKPVPEGVLEGDIPVSSLQLTVTGILASRQTDRAIVIIAKDGRQFSRGVGDAVPGYEARIVTISADRIVLEHQGRYEALYLYRDEVGATNHNSSTSKPPAAALSVVRNTLKSEPMKVMEYLAIVPQMKDNALAGYRLNPGKKTELFYRLGLHDNDLAVALNGMDLRDAEQGQQAMAQLPQLSELTLTIERDGQRQDITLTLDGAADDESEQHAGRDEP
ncbi:type II secretion system protein GspC [Candidatus Symbiopectobacterium sp. NZEC135]|nr:type II secretion system protein GspC [Candidatus Symbiopectobacterium sp. NZEC135]